jgi:L-proline amide hydrolase
VPGTIQAVEGHVDFRGFRTWYRVSGDLASGATPLLALHGGPGSTHHYFAPLERLASERPVFVYEVVGGFLAECD